MFPSVPGTICGDPRELEPGVRGAGDPRDCTGPVCAGEGTMPCACSPSWNGDIMKGVAAGIVIPICAMGASIVDRAGVGGKPGVPPGSDTGYRVCSEGGMHTLLKLAASPS